MKHPEKPPVLPQHRTVVSTQDSLPDAIGRHKDDIFFAAIETTRMPMTVTDPRQADNPIVFANRAFISMTGYDASEIVGNNCRFLQGPQTDPVTVRAIREAIEDKREITTEIINYRKDGSTFWNALFISPVHNADGELVYFFASQLDVSRRRDVEEALAQSQKMEALGQLTGGISHDFNNLLQVMSGHLELLRLRMDPARFDRAANERSLSQLQDAVKKASTLTQQLLAFSRKQQLEGRLVNLNTVVQGIGDLVEKTLGETVEIELDLDPQAPNCKLDPTQLELALLNVLVNARDAMNGDGRVVIKTGRVVVDGHERGLFSQLAPAEYASIAVSDTGSGIPPEIIKRVTEPFFTTKEEGKGTGLGLSMVYGFAKQSGGTVDIYSEMGRGTTVRMFFPGAIEQDRQRRDHAEPGAPRRGSERVLVVDDRVEVAQIAEDMLRSLGYEAHVASDGRDAIATAERLIAAGTPPDLLFSDIVMPGGMNGVMLAREMIRIRPQMKVLLTTGFANDDQLAIDRGVEFETLKKPYRLADLGRRVRIVLDGATGTRGR